MSFLSDIMGGGGQRQQQYEDFANRYEQGNFGQEMSHQEVRDRYNETAMNLPSDEYMQAAEQAFSRLSPQQRQEFAQNVMSAAQQNGVDMGQYNQQGGNYEDPRQLAQMTTQLHNSNPGFLSQLLGGQGLGMSQSQGQSGGMLGNPVVKMALAGVAAMAVRRAMGQG